MIYLMIIFVLAFGVFVGYLLRRQIGQYQVDSAEAKAKNILAKAKTREQEMFFKAKEESLEILERAKKEELVWRQELKIAEERLEKRQSVFEKKILEIEDQHKEIAKTTQKLEEAKIKIRTLYDQAKQELERVAGLSIDEAKKELLENLEKEMKDDIFVRIKKLDQYGSDEIDKKTKNLITAVIERYAASHTVEVSTSSVALPSDEVKGRIIGREGRNIKVIEQLTGTEIIIDDTPETVLVSAFNPIRRQLAKRVLEKLISDGRIQPARIEKVVEEIKKDLAHEIKKIGEEAVYQMGVTGLDPKLIFFLGRLKYRTSYGQNVLQHSLEVANLASMLAVELGANVSVAKKAGLLHDIGKAVDFEVQGTHPELGRDLAEKYGLPKEITIPIATHHEDHPPTLEAVIVKVADAISGARPGARRDTYEEYLKRLGELEDIAKTFPGVEKVYAIQAGRELRVFVRPQEIDDLAANKLARKIADRIENDLKYPGEIKVLVIRENRITEYAR
ncbi:MAG: ribonuclease Y [Patescibacteria group bacterium]|nr:ribonuclease Y [Patescibacteria group bacterium]MDD5164455.1 ribonuclease Y [Patescibacteria group bacterium]MDD5534374.1 ribonuclease Y [Patescibacteria group bacterium]